MAKAVKISIQARQSVKGPVREASSELEKFGKRASQAAEKMLSLERAKATFEGLKKVVELGTKAFEAMGKQSKAMQGELSSLSKASDKLWGSLGDVVAQSRSFQAVVDAITQMPLEEWVKDNADAIDGAMAASLKTGIVLAKGMTLAMAGIVEISITAATVIPASWQDAVKGVEIAAHKISEAWTWTQQFNVFAEVRAQARADLDAIAEAGERAAKAPWALGQAIDEAGRQVLEVDALVEATLAGLDKLDTRLADTERRRATAAAPGDPKAAAAAAKAESARQAAIAKAFDEINAAQIALQEYQAGAEQMMLGQLQSALDHQEQVWAGARKQMEAAARFEQQLLAERAAKWGSFARTVETSMGAIVNGVEAFSESEQAMAVAAAASTAIIAGVKAAYEIAEATAAFARYDLWAGAEHTAAAAQYAVVAATSVKDAGAAIGGGGAAGGSAPPSRPPEEPVRLSDTSRGEPVVTYVIEQHLHGAVIRESEAARDIVDLVASADRSGVVRSASARSGVRRSNARRGF